MAENAGANEASIRTYLERHGGSVQDPGGRGLTDEMARELGIDKPAALSGLLAQLETDGVITREMRGLRTFRIALASPHEAVAVVAPPAPPAPAPPAPAGNSGGRVSLREVRGGDHMNDAATPAPTPPTGATVSLREAISRRAGTLAPESPATTAAPPAPAPTDAPPAEPAPVVGPYGRSRSSGPAASSPSVTSPASSPAPPVANGPKDGAVSLRDAIAASGAANAEGSEAPPSAPPARSRFTSLRDGGFPTSPPPRPPVSAPSERPTPLSSGIAPEPRSKGGGREKRKGDRLRRSREKLALSALEVKSEPTRVILSAVGLTVIGLIIVAVITVFVAKGSTQKVITPGVTSSSTDACNVVTADMATKAFGGTDAGPPNFVLGDCVYGDGIVHELIVQVFRQDAKSLFDTGRTSSAQTVPSLGDDAYYVDGGLRIIKGTSLLEITLGPTPAASPTPAVLTLAAAAVDRLGP